jgi:steroid delta-isomerase-like uncharacterized protein
MMRHRCRSLLLLLLTACGGEEAVSPPPASPPPAMPPQASAGPSAPASTAEGPPPAPPKPPLVDLEKRTVSAFYAAFSEHDTKKLAALYAPDAVMAAPGPGGWKEIKGADEIVAAFAEPFTAMPDIRAAASTVYQKKDVAVVLWTAAGTNTGASALGQPTNKKAAVWGASVLWFDGGGRITRDEQFHDQATVLQQIGKMPGKPRDLATLPAGETTWVVATGTPDEDKLVDQMKATWPATWSHRDGKGYAEVITEDALHSEIASPNDYKGKAENLKELGMYAKALPDMSVTIDKAWAFAPNVVVAEFTFTGTMKGSLGPFKATGKPITIHGLDVDELKDGKMQKAVTFSNGLELLAALGALPKPAAPPSEKERP